MDKLIKQSSMMLQYKSPEKKQIKKKCKSAGNANKTKRIIKEKFKHYDLFTYKNSTKSKIVENSRENDYNQANIIPRQNLMEFDSPDKSEIIHNISCNENDFKIDKRFVCWIFNISIIFTKLCPFLLDLRPEKYLIC